MEDTRMRIRQLGILAAILALGLLALASPPPLSAGNCTLFCNCAASCSTVCLVGNVRVGFEQTTCGELGICAGAPSCGGLVSSSAQTFPTTINGTSGNDTISGNAGDDNLDGEAGIDLANDDADRDSCTAETVVSYP
jgi:hypothetical protein